MNVRFAAPAGVDKQARRALRSMDCCLQCGPNWIQGYAARWQDRGHSEELLRGAFTRTIKDAVATGKVKLLATVNGAPECVGTVMLARENEFGLWVHAEFFEGEFLNAARRGEVTGLAVGFFPVLWTWQPGERGHVLTHTEVRLLEIAAVTPQRGQPLSFLERTLATVLPNSRWKGKSE